jgi:tRNA (cytidine/uridine-2'-O-)-methyltransferase
MEKHGDKELFFFSTKAEKFYSDVKYPDGAYLVFGREDAGLPEWLLEKQAERCVKLPMRDGLRSLNLSNTAAVAAYEYLRQRGFPGLM